MDDSTKRLFRHRLQADLSKAFWRLAAHDEKVRQAMSGNLAMIAGVPPAASHRMATAKTVRQLGIGETLANYRHLLEGTGHFVLAREVELARLEVRQSLLQANVKAVTFQET